MRGTRVFISGGEWQPLGWGCKSGNECCVLTLLPNSTVLGYYVCTRSKHKHILHHWEIPIVDIPEGAKLWGTPPTDYKPSTSTLSTSTPKPSTPIYPITQCMACGVFNGTMLAADERTCYKCGWLRPECK